MAWMPPPPWMISSASTGTISRPGQAADRNLRAAASDGVAETGRQDGAVRDDSSSDATGSGGARHGGLWPWAAARHAPRAPGPGLPGGAQHIEILGEAVKLASALSSVASARHGAGPGEAGDFSTCPPVSSSTSPAGSQITASQPSCVRKLGLGLLPAEAGIAPRIEHRAGDGEAGPLPVRLHRRPRGPCRHHSGGRRHGRGCAVPTARSCPWSGWSSPQPLKRQATPARLPSPPSRKLGPNREPSCRRAQSAGP